MYDIKLSTWILCWYFYKYLWPGKIQEGSILNNNSKKYKL